MELLCEKVLSSSTAVLSPGDGLRRVFEAISSGLLLPGSPGLLDPCEKDPVDAAAYLTDQQREDITFWAQVRTCEPSVIIFGGQMTVCCIEFQCYIKQFTLFALNNLNR